MNILGVRWIIHTLIKLVLTRIFCCFNDWGIRVGKEIEWNHVFHPRLELRNCFPEVWDWRPTIIHDYLQAPTFKTLILKLYLIIINAFCTYLQHSFNCLDFGYLLIQTTSICKLLYDLIGYATSKLSVHIGAVMKKKWLNVLLK